MDVQQLLLEIVKMIVETKNMSVLTKQSGHLRGIASQETLHAP